MSDANSIVTSSKKVFTSTLFSVDQYTIGYPNGKKVVHDVVERKPTVSVFPITEKYELYLVSQFRYTLGRQSLEAMAGFIDQGESTLQAAKRELIEETGIRAAQWEELARIELGASVIRAKSTMFLAKDLELGESSPEEDEDIQLIKIPLDEAVAKVMNSEIRTSASMIGILMLDKLRREKKL